MNNTAKKILVLLDAEAEYAEHMSEYLRRNKDLPWEVHTYTDAQTLLLGEESSQVHLLMAAESAYTRELALLQPAKMVILNESGLVRIEDVEHINKYQCADKVVAELLRIHAEMSDEVTPRLLATGGTHFLALYTPVHRSLQTTFALTLSQLLAQKESTLYLNFEYYAGNEELLAKESGRDLADLLYFLSAEPDKFVLRMKSMICRIGSVDYIPPMASGMNILSVEGKDWLRLLQQISAWGAYRYVILDLSDGMQGLFDILRQCEKIFTIESASRIARAKMMQYEQMLLSWDYRDVLEKSRYCRLPPIRKIPGEISQYAKGELADYIRMELGDICKEV